MPKHGTVLPYEQVTFSAGSCGGGGFCTNASKRQFRCGRPVLAVYVESVRGGGWWALCVDCAARKGLAGQTMTTDLTVEEYEALLDLVKDVVADLETMVEFFAEIRRRLVYVQETLPRLRPAERRFGPTGTL